MRGAVTSEWNQLLSVNNFSNCWYCLTFYKNNNPETHETRVVGSTNVKLWKLLSLCSMQSLSPLSQLRNKGDETSGNKPLPSGISVYWKCQAPNILICEQMPVFGWCCVLSLWTLSVGSWKAANNVGWEVFNSSLYSSSLIIISQLVNKKGFLGQSTGWIS